MKIKADYTNTPQWRELTVKSSLPEELKCLDEVAHNLWWVWNFEARDLFCDLDPGLYHDVKHNPVMLLERLSFERKEEILKDKSMMKRVKDVYAAFQKYMSVGPDTKRPSVAYFCIEIFFFHQHGVLISIEHLHSVRLVCTCNSIGVTYFCFSSCSTFCFYFNYTV